MTDPERRDEAIGEEGARGGAFTTRMLKAMSHPLRRRILRELARVGAAGARAADLAAALGEPANALSFHLRTLAEADLIHEAPELARDRRDRVWVRATGGPANIGGRDQSEEDRSLAGAVATALIGDVHELLDRIGRRAQSDGVEGAVDRGARLIISQRNLTPQQFDRLLERFDAALAEVAAGDDAPPQEDAEFYEIAIAIGGENT